MTRTDNVEELCLLGNDKTQLFAKEKYVIPLYQRAFAWTEKEIEQLLEDIMDIDDEENYYLGSLIVAKRNNSYEVIDGQQRLTTLYLLLNCLGIETGDTLSFECREKSNYTLKNIIKAVNTEQTASLDTEKLEPSITDGIDIIRKKLLIVSAMENTDIERFKEQFKEKLERVRIYRIEIPDQTDLNRYFEIMNTRGEQLEQHDVLKAQLMRHLGDEKDKFALIWEAVSDMTGYVQMHFDVETRNTLFGNTWNELPNADKLLTSEKSPTAENTRSIAYIISNNTFSEREEGVFIENKNSSDRVRFESIIEFPYFLLHALRVYVRQKGIVSANEKEKLIDDLLDDKKLTAAFDKVIKNGRLNGENLDESNFAWEFINCLLKLRFLFDKYIIKREYKNENLDGEWSLKELRAGKNKHAYCVKTPFSKSGEHEKTDLSRTNLMLQSCLRVSYTSPKIMHWITRLLNWLYEDSVNDYDKLNEFQIVIEQNAQEAVAENFLKHKKYNDGVNTQHIVFNYLDYLLWKEDKDKEFVFEFRNSVEHWYPRNPSEGTFGSRTQGNDIDFFGNLCIIQRNINSKFSNMSPEAKKTTFKNMILNGSLKLRLMAENTVSADKWRQCSMKKHGEEMIKILEKACSEYLQDK